MTKKRKVLEVTVDFEPDRMKDAHLIEAYANLVPLEKIFIDVKGNEFFTKKKHIILDKELLHE